MFSEVCRSPACPCWNLGKSLSWARCHRFVLPTRSPSWAELARRTRCPVYRRGLMKLQPGRKVFPRTQCCVPKAESHCNIHTWQSRRVTTHQCLLRRSGLDGRTTFFCFFFRSPCRLWTGQGWPVNGGVRREDSGVPSVCSYHW